MCYIYIYILNSRWVFYNLLHSLGLTPKIKPKEFQHLKVNIYLFVFVKHMYEDLRKEMSAKERIKMLLIQISKLKHKLKKLQTSPI